MESKYDCYDNEDKIWGIHTGNSHQNVYRLWWVL